MAHIQDRKSGFYSQKQSIRDESSAPQHLESAGDVLIKDLAKKQTRTSTTLEEQLEVVQNFEKGFELNPDNRKGIASLEDFRKHFTEKEETSRRSSGDSEEVADLEELMSVTGLTRHELELSLCEKPNSTISQLYRFAIRNNRQRDRTESLELRLPEHPFNRLKEIEREYFGHLRGETSKPESEPVIVTETEDKKVNKKKKHRKRRKKTRDEPRGSSPAKRAKCETESEARSPHEDAGGDVVRPRASLWDVKDMKEWKEGKVKGCRPQTFYTIKEGKIIKLEKESGREDIT